MTLRIEFAKRHMLYAAAIVALLVLDRGGVPDFLPDVLPDDAPIEVDGLHVLVVYQDLPADKLTTDQKAIIYGAPMRAFLDSVCGEDGWRMLDADTDMTHAEQVWKDAMAVPRQSTPWLVVAGSKSGFSGPLTMPPDEFKAVVEEHK